MIATEQLVITRMSVKGRLDLVKARICNPPVLACWNKQADLALVADLQIYLDDLNEEIASRTPSP